MALPSNTKPVVVQDPDNRERRLVVNEDGSINVVGGGGGGGGDSVSTADLDSGAGTDTKSAVGLLIADDGGPAVAGYDNPFPVYAPNGISLNDGATVAITGPVNIIGAVAIDDDGGSITIDATSLPLPTGAATSAKQPALGTAGTASADVISVQGVASGVALKTDGSATTQPVSGTVAVSGTVPVSAAALPLPSGASTAAKQPTLGVAGTPSADLISIQGAPGMTAVKVDGSAVTQPVSGTVAVSGTVPVSAASLPLPSGAATAAKQPALGTAGSASADVITVQGIASGTAMPVSIAAAVPVTDNSGTLTVDAPVGTPVFTRLSDGTAALTTTSGRLAVDGSGVTQPVSAASLPLPSGAATAAKQPALGTAGTASSDVISVQGIASGTPMQAIGAFASPTFDITRPADTTAYAGNDALSDSTSAPTSGGFTLTGAARASGKSGIITDALIASSNPAGTTLQGELWIFNQAVTNVNDNAAFAVSDAEIKTLVAKIPFTLVTVGNNGAYHAQNLGFGFTTVGSANLRCLVLVKNAYTPVSAEVFTVTLKCLQVD